MARRTCDERKAAWEKSMEHISGIVDYIHDNHEMKRAFASLLDGINADMERMHTYRLDPEPSRWCCFRQPDDEGQLDAWDIRIEQTYERKNR